MPYAFGYCMHLGEDEPCLTIARQKRAVEDYYCQHLRDDLDWAGVYVDAADSQRLPLFGREAGGSSSTGRTAVTVW